MKLLAVAKRSRGGAPYEAHSKPRDARLTSPPATIPKYKSRSSSRISLFLFTVVLSFFIVTMNYVCEMLHASMFFDYSILCRALHRRKSRYP